MKLLRTPLAHQLIAIEFANAHPNPFLAMAMRTGKSFTAIRYVKKKYPRGKFLVCAPLTVLVSWGDELKKEFINYKALLAGDSEAFLEEKGSGWYLVGPAALRSNPFILSQNWDVIIVDESTLMRNPKAEITKALNHAGAKSKERICLSGWPCPEGDEDWFEQMRFLGHGEFMGHRNFWSWRGAHFKPAGYDWVPKPGASLAIKKALKDKVFFLSAKEAGMPDKFVSEQRYVSMHPDQKEIYAKVEKEFAAEYQGHSLETKWATVRDVRLHQIASGEVPWDDGSRTRFSPKLDDVCQLLRGELSREQVVVFFRFDEGVRAVGDALARTGIHSVRITGSNTLGERADSIHKFQRGDARVILVQAQCGQFALDLSCSSTAIFFSQGHSYEVWAQCRQRLKHPTKSSANLLIYMITKGTLEEHILPAMQEKKSVGDFYFTKIYNHL